MPSRLVFGLLEVFCERILLEHDWVPVRDLPALMAMPEPIVYKATADRISRLQYGQLFVAFYGRVAEARSMATVYASADHLVEAWKGGGAAPPRTTDEATAKLLGTALADICEIARSILRADPTSPQIAEALIANTLAGLDAAQRCRELLSPPPDPRPASPVTAPKQ